jgi:hypothetical protein
MDQGREGVRVIALGNDLEEEEGRRESSLGSLIRVP